MKAFGEYYTLLSVCCLSVWPSALLAVPDQFQASCNERCHCNKTTISCVNTGYKGTDLFLFMRSEVYEDLDTVIATDNTFDLLDNENLFGIGMVHQRLTLLNLSDNAIRYIHGDAFSGIPRLEVFDLSNNHLRRIDGDLLGRFDLLRTLYLNNAFNENDYANDTTEISATIKRLFHESRNGFRELEKVSLERNQLSTLEPDTFCKLPALSRLSLAGNRLTTFNFDIKCFPDLHFLDLSSNYFQHVSPDTVNVWNVGFPVLEELDFSNNDLLCDCHMKEFIKFAWKERDIFVSRDATFCDRAYPALYEDERVFKVDADKLLCASEMAPSMHRTYLLLALALMGLLLVIACFCYRSSTSLLHRMLSNKSPKYTVVGGYNKLNGADQDEGATVEAVFV